MSDELRALIFAPLGRDGPLAERIMREGGVTTHLCSSLPQLCAEIPRGAAAVLLTEEVLADPAARELRLLLEAQPPWSDLPVLIFGSSVATLGDRANVTLIDRPVRIRALLSTVRSALRARRRQYEARNVLESVEQSVRDRDQFLAMLGHELRNPLAAILTASEVLERKAGDSFAPVRAVIGRQVRHLSRLVNDLLEVSRVTSGKIALRLGTVDLNEVVAQVAQTYEAKAHAQGLVLELRLHSQPLTLQGDGVRLEQVMGNLLANAVKYTPAPGRIEIETTLAEGRALLRVRDTGMGIPGEMLPRIFDLFVQAPGALDRAEGGMGIGLTLVQRLVALHGGAVGVSSAGEGQGTTFEVRLPLSRGTGLTAGSGGELVTASRRILLVEDNLDSREMLQMVLTELGHRVDTAADGVAAVERALAEPPEVMIVDIGLPLADGYQVAERVRSSLGPTVRLIALTGYGQQEDRARALRAGFDKFLTKPVEVSELSSALA